MADNGWKQYRTATCDACGGTGKQLDHVTLGRTMRVLRKGAGLGLRELARRLGLSAAYISDLELGRRNWSAKHYQAYRKALR